MTKLREHFELFKKSTNLFDKSLDELLWLFYKQGNLDVEHEEEEMSTEELNKFIEDICFFDFDKNCIENPESMVPLKQDECVEVCYPCGGHDKCIAWPDRCEDCGGDGVTCGKKIINLSKLCGVSGEKIENIRQTVTKEEIDAIASILSKIS